MMNNVENSSSFTCIVCKSKAQIAMVTRHYGYLFFVKLAYKSGYA